MTDGTLPPEIAFFRSPVGGGFTILASILVFVWVVRWCFQPGDETTTRRNIFYASILGTLLMAAIDLAAVDTGWWGGAFYEIPLPVLLAIDLPLTVGMWWLWLRAYHWLETRSQRPLLIYLFVALIFIPVVLFSNPNLTRQGFFEVGSTYTIWVDVLLGQLVVWAPILLYTWLQRRSRVPAAA